MVIFKLFRRIINGFLKIIVFTIIGVFAIIISMYKNEKPLAADNSNIKMQNYINIKVESEIQKLLTGSADSVSIGTPEEIINKEINKYLLEQYDSNGGYIFENEYYRIQDVWVELDENYMDVMISVHLNTPAMTYKTRLKLTFEVKETSTGVITFRLRGMKLGNLPLRWAVVLTTEIFNVEEVINEALIDIGDFDKNRLELNIDLVKLLDKDSDFIVSILQFAKENELLQYGVVQDDDKYILGGKVNFEKLRTDDIPEQLTNDHKIKSQDELESMIKDRILANLFTKGNQIDLSEEDMQKIIDFTVMGEIETTDEYVFKGEIYEDYGLYVYQPYSTLTDQLILNIPIKIGRGYNFFSSCIQFELSLKPRENDLILVVENTYIQNVPVNKDIVNLLFENFESDLTTFVNEPIVIENFFESFIENGVTIQEIVITEGKMSFIFNGFSVDDTLTEILEAIDNPEINYIIEDIIKNIDDEEKLLEMSDELVNNYNNLSDTEQKLIMDIVKENMDQIPDFGDKLGENGIEYK